MIIGLLILSVVLFFGGGPTHHRLGFHYWKDPGATKEYLVDGAAGRFCATLYIVIYSVFSFNFAPELLVITGGEMESPRRNLPNAARRYFYRLLIFYIGGTFAVGLIVSSNAPGLLTGTSDAASSPWVIAIKQAGINGLDSLINAVIITSAWSSGNSYLYMSSRSLYSLALAGSAPSIFTRCNRWGVPYPALMASSTFALLAYLNVGESGTKVFDWFINLTNMSGFISWICCCIIFLRFRKACAIHEINDLPYKSVLQPHLAWLSLSAFVCLCLLNGFSIFFHGKWSVTSLLTSYIGLPIFLCIYFIHRIYSCQTLGHIIQSRLI
jgi:amino acid transporter